MFADWSAAPTVDSISPSPPSGAAPIPLPTVGCTPLHLGCTSLVLLLCDCVVPATTAGGDASATAYRLHGSAPKRLAVSAATKRAAVF